ncbi:Hydroxyacylglutathione hydrolase [Staphylococcus aureus]|nr:Hydroxyacylglutathione hydrolase [Staphylococcus aureus]
MRISSLTLGLVDTNTYFIENDKAVILIDPSGESEKIIKKLNQINKPLKAILLTHAHFETEIVQAKLGNDAGITGAAGLIKTYVLDKEGVK